MARKSTPNKANKHPTSKLATSHLRKCICTCLPTLPSATHAPAKRQPQHIHQTKHIHPNNTHTHTPVAWSREIRTTRPICTPPANTTPHLSRCMLMHMHTPTSPFKGSARTNTNTHTHTLTHHTIGLPSSQSHQQHPIDPATAGYQPVHYSASKHAHAQTD